MGEHECQRCGSSEWSDVDYSGCSECREPPELLVGVGEQGYTFARVPGLPLTTGEGARKLISAPREWWADPATTQLFAERDEALAECGRLREQLDAARQALLDFDHDRARAALGVEGPAE